MTAIGEELDWVVAEPVEQPVPERREADRSTAVEHEPPDVGEPVPERSPA